MTTRDWEARVAAAWASFDERTDDENRALIESLASELTLLVWAPYHLDADRKQRLDVTAVYSANGSRPRPKGSMPG